MRLSRRLFALAAVAVTAVAATAAAPAQAQGPGKPKRVLLVTHSGGFIHDSVGVAEDVLKDIGPKNGFEVTCYRWTADTNTPAFEKYKKDFRARTGKTVEPENCGRVNKDTLKNFDCVLFFTTGSGPQRKNVGPLTPDELKDLTEWVKAGGAFAGTHCASDTLYDTLYGELIGGYFATHPPGLQKVKINVEDPKHPAAVGFESGMPYEDEIYIFTDKPYTRDRLHLILSCEKGSFAPKNGTRPDNDYAISWCREEGKGKVFYTSLGHQKKVWNDAEHFQKHLIGGLKWVTGQVPGDASPTGHK
jgi:type 1 glutamine amidotransferase